MKKVYRLQDYVVRGKEIFVGLEDSKRTWKLAVRSEKMVIHQVSMEARYLVLIGYLRNKFPECTIHLIYEVGFKGFNLYDQFTGDGIDCVVIPLDQLPRNNSRTPVLNWRALLWPENWLSECKEA